MTSITITNLDDNYYELRKEFEKLASIVPIIPKNECISELEFIEFVIIYIRQLQEILSYDQWNEHIYKLPLSMKNSSSYLFNQLSRIQTNENSSIIHRNPLTTINLDNIQLS